MTHTTETIPRTHHRVLVTGGGGYLGSVLVRQLLEEGHHVTVLDSFLWQQASLLDCCAFPHFEVVRGDARDEPMVKTLVRAHDTIVPLAALVGMRICDVDPIAAETIMRDGLKLLLAHASPSQRILYPATNSGYGVGAGDAICTEETPLAPVSLYGRLKVEGEARVLERASSISLRMATLFGVSPRMRRDLLVNDYVYRAVHEGSVLFFEGQRRRNLIHVHDAGRAFLHAMDHFETMKGRAYNVGMDDANLTRVQVCEAIKRCIPSFVYVQSGAGHDPDIRDCIVSSARLTATGFRAQYSLDRGIRELIKCYAILPRALYVNV
ncbi:NAD-dependent epimerase/dehydratase family protein [Pendulispora albinea]|uniref:NAD(P)-dependent oxidoreductase n=1 Tax=Pendulispora albinea TaxID=2741071 RepID=A0ABZ2MBK3_9BACT